MVIALGRLVTDFISRLKRLSNVVKIVPCILAAPVPKILEDPVALSGLDPVNKLLTLKVPDPGVFLLIRFVVTGSEISVEVVELLALLVLPKIELSVGEIPDAKDLTAVSNVAVVDLRADDK